MKKLKILIACEYSGTVRNAFGALGHNVVSCDLLPGELNLFEDSFGTHYQGDVRDILYDGWDMMVGFPPCTFLSFVNNRGWYNPGQKERRLEAMRFFKLLYNAPINHICIENPLGFPVRWKKYSQIVNPFQFGEPYKKRTCLWLRNLHPLKPTNIVNPNKYYSNTGMVKYCTEMMGKGGSRDAIRKNRSKFWKGIAEAMADQWTNEINNLKIQNSKYLKS